VDCKKLQLGLIKAAKINGLRRFPNTRMAVTLIEVEFHSNDGQYKMFLEISFYCQGHGLLKYCTYLLSPWVKGIKSWDDSHCIIIFGASILLYDPFPFLTSKESRKRNRRLCFHHL
jgi:hypothetical protein